MRLALLLAAATFAWAQKPQLPEPYQTLAGLANAAPPEFAADTLLRIVESGQVADREVKRDLLEQAFRLATAATFPVRKRSWPGTFTDTRSGSLSQAYELKLDTLSLQSRAVSDLMRLDAAAARSLFAEIPPLALPPLSCDDALFYEVSDFYQTLGAVFNSAFTASERAKQEHMNFLLDYIGQTRSFAQVVPLVETIQGAGLTPAQKEIALTKFGAMLPNLQPDDRSYSALLSVLGPMTEPLVNKSTLKSAGCKDDLSTVEAPGGQVVSAKSDATPKVERYWFSAESRRLFEDGMKLRYTADGKLLSDADRSKPEWQQKLADYLSAVAAWKAAEGESEAAYYNEKCVVYIALVELIPPGAQRDRTLQAFVDFIVNSSLLRQSPVEWFLPARTMLERMRPDNIGEPGKVVDAYERSGNPILVLETAVEKYLGTKAPGWVSNAKE